MAADIGYETQLLTLIKSLCYHHRNLKIYLLHKTFPNEWFDCVNKWLQQLNSKIISANVLWDFSKYKTASHITETTFYRLAIPYLPEHRVIYLDCDIVINGSLLELMEIPFDGSPLLAVEDFVLNNIEHWYPKYPDLKPYFNAGMLVFNIPLWEQQNISDMLLERLDTEENYILYADQDLLNSLLCKHWKGISSIYNFQTDAIIELSQRRRSMDVVDEKGWLKSQEPIVIHYTGPYKPWKKIIDNTLFREKYWFYYQLSWQEIIDRSINLKQ
ncbi:TPA: glycosyltransferase family 8 protein [Mannheimia haemolytica]